MLPHNQKPLTPASPVSPAVIKELLSEGLLIKHERVENPKSPRENSLFTWVGVDEDIPRDHSHSKTGLHSNECATIDQVVDNYFDRMNLNEKNFVWWPVVIYESRDSNNEINYACYGTSKHKKADLCEKSRGFMFIERLKAIELYGISVEDKSEVEVNNDKNYPNPDNEMKRLFDQELDAYTAWELKDVYDIILLTIDKMASKKIENVFNTQGSIENAISQAKRRLSEMRGLPA